MANTITAEGAAWIRQQQRQLAPCRMAAILGVAETDVAVILKGGAVPAVKPARAPAARTATRKPARRPAS